MSGKIYKIYSVTDYRAKKDKTKDEYNGEDAYEEHIKLKTKDINKIVEELEKNEKDCLHLRIVPTGIYTLYIDLDGYDDRIEFFISNILIKFLNEKYGLDVKKSEVSYTTNTGDETKHHLAIPKFYAKGKKLLEIVENLTKFSGLGKNANGSDIIDVGIYEKKWFRLPEQMKGFNVDYPDTNRSKHKIVNGHQIFAVWLSFWLSLYYKTMWQ